MLVLLQKKQVNVSFPKLYQLSGLCNSCKFTDQVQLPNKKWWGRLIVEFNLVLWSVPEDDDELTRGVLLGDDAFDVVCPGDGHQKDWSKLRVSLPFRQTHHLARSLKGQIHNEAPGNKNSFSGWFSRRWYSRSLICFVILRVFLRGGFFEISTYYPKHQRCDN